MSGHLEAIRALDNTLRDLGGVEGRLAGVPDWMRELHDEHTQKKSEIEAAGQASDDAARERREAEAELADTQERLKRFQEQIGRVSTQREYGALLKEIDLAKEQINSLEQQALSALERSETASDEKGKLEEGFAELDQRYNAELAKWEEEKPAVEKERARLRQLAAEQQEKLPRPVVAFFLRLRERFGDGAMAAIKEVSGARGANKMWHCTACSYRVRPQVLVEIRTHGKLIQCESCKRVLFYEEEEEAES